MKTVILERDGSAANAAIDSRVLSFDKSLILTLGNMSIIAGVLLASLGNAFIDNVLIGKDFDRAPPIILWYAILGSMIFALDYSSKRMLKLRENTPGWVDRRYFSSRTSTFSILLNGLLICVLSNIIALVCLLLLGFVYLALYVYLKTFRRQASGEASDAICTILNVCMLFVCGLFVMHGRITLGNLFAVNTFSGHIFHTAVSLMRQSLKARLKDGGEETEPAGNPCQAQLCLASLAEHIFESRATVFFTLFLALMGTIANGVFLFLQEMNFSDNIPSGDWSGLLLNCIFMSGFSVCALFSRKGNAIGFHQIFHGKVPGHIEENLDYISDLSLSAVFAIYYGIQIGRYNELLASRMTIGTIAACAVFALMALSPRRLAWGGDFSDVLDIFSAFSLRCLTVFMYCVVALGVTDIGIGVFFVFLTAFKSFFRGMVSLVKILCLFLDARAAKSGGLPDNFEANDLF